MLDENTYDENDLGTYFRFHRVEGGHVEIDVLGTNIRCRILDEAGEPLEEVIAENAAPVATGPRPESDSRRQAFLRKFRRDPATRRNPRMATVAAFDEFAVVQDREGMFVRISSDEANDNGLTAEIVKSGEGVQASVSMDASVLDKKPVSTP